MKETEIKLINELIKATEEKKLLWEKTGTYAYAVKPDGNNMINIRKSIYPLRRAPNFGVNHVELLIWGNGKEMIGTSVSQSQWSIDFYDFDKESDNYQVLNILYNVIDKSFLTKISEEPVATVISSMLKVINENPS